MSEERQQSICIYQILWQKQCAKYRTYKEQGEDDDELENCMAKDVLHHSSGYEGVVSAVGPPQEQRFGGRLCGKSQRSKCVHDQIDPQHLHSLKGWILHTQKQTKK